MAKYDKDFKVKNGLIVEGSTATVNGNSVLTTASSINALSDVNISGATANQVLTYVDGEWVPADGGSSVEITDSYTSGNTIYVGSVPPSSMSEGDVWIDQGSPSGIFNWGQLITSLTWGQLKAIRGYV